MPDYTWPSDLDDAGKLLGVVGSFWAETYAGNDLVASLLHAKAQHQAQAQLDLLDVVASLSRFTVPIFHKENWTLLPLKASELNAPNLPAFDGTYNWDGQIKFDTPVASGLFAWPAPPGLVDAKVVLNQITDSSLTCVKGTDFFVVPGAVWFRENPFLHPGVRILDVYEDGVVTDRVAHVWVYRGEFDWATTYKQFGYVLGFKLNSSRKYREVVNAVYDGLVEGTSARCLEDFMSAVCDVPLARGSETVRYVLDDGRKKWVVTDDNVYGFARGATVIVVPGQDVRAGDPLVDALRFFDTNRGEAPAEVRALSVGRGFLSSAYFRELTFENLTVPLVVEENVDGYTKVSFDVRGWPADVEQFWDDTHAAGVAANDTLAMRLDTRTNKTGQPTAVALPATVNPLEFLCENVLRGNFFFIVVKPEGFGPEASGLPSARILRRLIPPQTGCVILVQLEYGGDIVTMDGTGDETDAGYQEEIEVFLGNTIEETIDPATYVAEDVRVVQIGGHCQ